MSYVLKGVGDISSSQAAVMLEQGKSKSLFDSVTQSAGRALEKVPIVGELFTGSGGGSAAKSGGSSFPVVPVLAGVGLVAYLVVRSRKKGRK